VGTILVAVDGSATATLALEFAAEEAVVRDATLKVITALDLSNKALSQARPVPELFDNLQRLGEDMVGEAVKRAEELHPGLTCETEVLHGRPQDAIVEAAEGVTMLVVGRRGQGGLASLLLGSVAGYVVNHSPCPVVVVPPAAK
jgi:nucleotide-binding universal stress UspA family protein